MPGMRRSSKSELRMLREMMWHFGLIKRCRFCKKPLLTWPDEREMRFGRRDFPQVKTKLCIHHEDEDRTNNDDDNRKPAHSKCHRQYHIKKNPPKRKRHGK